MIVKKPEPKLKGAYYMFLTEDQHRPQVGMCNGGWKQMFCSTFSSLVRQNEAYKKKGGFKVRSCVSQKTHSWVHVFCIRPVSQTHPDRLSLASPNSFQYDRETMAIIPFYTQPITTERTIRVTVLLVCDSIFSCIDLMSCS